MTMKTLLAVLLVAVTAASASAQTQLTTGPATQYNPAISGNYVVWTDYRAGNWDIWGMDLRTRQEFPVCTNTATQDQPAINGDTVVWRDYRNGNWDIFGYNITTKTEFPVCTAPGAQTNPVVSGSRVAWQDRRSGTWDVYGLDLQHWTETAIAAGPGNQQEPCLGPTLCVYSDNAKGNYDIMARRLGGEPFTVADAPYDEARPRLSGNTIIWRGRTNGSTWDIWGKNIMTGQTFSVCTAPSDQWYANISGNLVAWDDHRSGNWDIYGYDLTTRREFPVCTVKRDQLLPDVDGNAVVWHDMRSGTAHIWVENVPQAVAVPPIAQPPPTIHETPGTPSRAMLAVGEIRKPVVTISDTGFSVWWAPGAEGNPSGVAKSFFTGYTLGDLPWAGDWLTAMRLNVPVTFDILAGIDAEGGNALVGFGTALNWGNENFRLSTGLGLLSTGDVVPYVGFTARFD